MWVVAGLGNPGRRYANDRHNIGFMAIEWMARRWGGPAFQKRFQAHFCQIQLDNHPVLLVQPQTYMNLSGQALATLCTFYKVPCERLLVIHDELDLTFGQLKLKQGGGDGGHRGLRSINAELSSRDYGRLRFGIGRPDQQDVAIADFVLSAFPEDQRAQLTPCLDQTLEMTETWIREGMTRAMNLWNGRHPLDAKVNTSTDS